MTYQNILTETRESVGVITINRPDAMNALSSPLMRELSDALDGFETDDGIGAIVLTLRSRAGVRKQRISDQVARRPEDAIEVVKVTVGSGV